MGAGSLLATTDGARWFDVPEGVTLPDGDLTVQGLARPARGVDPAAIAPFEIDAAAGRERARLQLVEWLGAGERGLDGLRRLLADQGRDPAALAPLAAVLGRVGGALRQPGDPAPDGPVPDLQAKMEGWVRGALEDPDRADRIRRAADELRAAAARLRAPRDPKG